MPLEAPLKPPQERVWRGALVAPFAANTALVLHKCPADNGAGVKYLVQALHNEKPVMMPVSRHYIENCFSVLVLSGFKYFTLGLAQYIQKLKNPLAKYTFKSFDFSLSFLGSCRGNPI